MTYNSSQIFESYIPVYDAVPEGWEQARPFIVEQLKALANAANIREIGWYLDEELLSGKQFIPSPTGLNIYPIPEHIPQGGGLLPSGCRG